MSCPKERLIGLSQEKAAQWKFFSEKVALLLRITTEQSELNELL